MVIMAGKKKQGKNDPPAPIESVEQICLFRWVKLSVGKYPELDLLYHIPNEGKRSRYTGAKMKAEGLKSGVPDLCLPVAQGNYHGLYIEMKRQGGRLTKEQAEWLTALTGQGYAAAVCYGWEAASEVITRYLKGGELEAKE